MNSAQTYAKDIVSYINIFDAMETSSTYSGFTIALMKNSLLVPYSDYQTMTMRRKDAKQLVTQSLNRIRREVYSK